MTISLGGVANRFPTTEYRFQLKSTLECMVVLTACGYSVGAMSTVMSQARRMSLALHVIAVVCHGHLTRITRGPTSRSAGLTRLNRDLMRRGGGKTTAELAASDWISSRDRRTWALTA